MQGLLLRLSTLDADAESAVRVIRGAAAALHPHHSSLAARVARAESVLGFSPADPPGRLRAHLALALVRLLADAGAAPG
ncbi:helix-turn-helix domain-containing protein [Nonomuraea sp. NPDC049421]|uniref:helix-turn-helix domain-containing protein n=1 Tax=Nonomuraea sp. NPDC049421 TaxID=3155275 RepID=UPI00341E741E